MAKTPDGTWYVDKQQLATKHMGPPRSRTVVDKPEPGSGPCIDLEYYPPEQKEEGAEYPELFSKDIEITAGETPVIHQHMIDWLDAQLVMLLIKDRAQ